MQMVGSRRRVFAIALAARTPGERQTRNDIPHVLDAVLRPRRVASIRPKGNADAAQQTKSVRVSERISTNGAARLIRSRQKKAAWSGRYGVWRLFRACPDLR